MVGNACTRFIKLVVDVCTPILIYKLADIYFVYINIGNRMICIFYLDSFWILNLSESFCFLFSLKRGVLVFLSSSALAFSYALFQEKADRNLLSGVEPSNFLEDNVRSKLELSTKHFHHQLKSKAWLLNPKFVILNYILINIIYHS